MDDACPRLISWVTLCEKFKSLIGLAGATTGRSELLTNDLMLSVRFLFSLSF